MAKTADITTRARAPGKIILSGEYAVLCGNPALAMAVDKFCYIKITSLPASFLPSQASSHAITFVFKDLNYQCQLTIDELLSIADQVMVHGQNSSRKNTEVLLKIREMIVHPYFLGVYAFAFFARKLQLKEILPDDLLCEITSELPIGSGMGSSAALIMGMLHGLLNYFSLPAIPAAIALEWGREIEGVQHDHSSGMDLYLAHHGGGIKFQDGKAKSRHLFKGPFFLVNTGKPQATTGECVREVKKRIAHAALLKDLYDVTSAIDDAWQKNDIQSMCDGIRANHVLLKAIGVVPSKAALFIEEINKLGFAAKVSGAGSIRGDNAGMVLVVGEGDMAAVLAKYSYQVLRVAGERHGVSIL
jgi:mevalonate kinase